MHRALSLALLLVLAACAAEAAPDTSGPPSTTTTSTTSSTTTTTTMPTTTTTAFEVEVEGAGSDLSELVTRMYEGASGPRIPGGVSAAFSDAEGDPPTSARASVADWNDEVRLGVVEAGDDVTLAVADPDWRVVGGWWPSMGIEPRLGRFPKLVAVVGSDARSSGNRESSRADSIHFLGLDGKGNAAVVGVPRDSWVPIPGAGHSKINAALAFGGPDMMMDAFVELTDLEFDGYLLTGFQGFEGMIEILGGLEMDVPRDFNDQAAKAYIDAGEQVLNAAEALAVARTRKTLPRGDFQRQEHGGLVMIAAQAMVRAGGPSSLPATLAAARPHFSTDINPAQLLILSAAITRVDPDRAVNVVAPGGTGMAGSASVVFLHDSAELLWEDLADGKLDED